MNFWDFLIQGALGIVTNVLDFFPVTNNLLDATLVLAPIYARPILILVLFWVGPFVSFKMLQTVVTIVVIVEGFRAIWTIVRFLKKALPVVLGG